MITESDRLDEQQSNPPKGKSKRERRRLERARRRGEWQCGECRHALMDHGPMRNSRDKFCHVCLEVCTHK